VYSRILEIGSYTTNASAEWWGLFLSPDGCSLSFSAQGGGTQTNYLTAPVSLASNIWANVAVTYSATNTALYINGILTTNGPGMSIYPGSTTLSNGFFVGSDSSASNQFNGVLDDLASFNIPLDSNTVFATYSIYSFAYYGAPLFYPSLTNAPSTPTNTPVFDVISGPGILQFVSNNASGCITSSNFWITNVVAHAGTNQSVNVTFKIEGGVDGAYYDVYGTAALASPITNATWVWLGQAHHCATYTMNIQTNNTAFFVLGSPQDSDSDGLTDAYELLVSHTDPNNSDTFGLGITDGWQIEYFGQTGIDPFADVAGDGWTSIYKYQNGLNPNQLITPPAPSGFAVNFNTNGNIVLSWLASADLPSSGAGAVSGYTVSLEGYSNVTLSASATNYVFDGEAFLDDWESGYPADGVPDCAVQANYVHTNSAWATVNMLSPRYSAEAYVVRGPGGHFNLVVPSLPPNISGIRVWAAPYLQLYPKSSDYDEPQTGFTAGPVFFDVPATSLTNGVYVISDTALPLYGEYTFVTRAFGPGGPLGAHPDTAPSTWYSRVRPNGRFVWLR
jgi:hypothetical protein